MTNRQKFRCTRLTRHPGFCLLSWNARRMSSRRLGWRQDWSRTNDRLRSCLGNSGSSAAMLCAKPHLDDYGAFGQWLGYRYLFNSLVLFLLRESNG